MPIAKRISQLCRADVNAVLDQLEDPEATVKQAIRDMEDIVEQQSAILEQQQRQLAHMNFRLDEVSKALAKIDDELELCLRKNQEQLLRITMRRKLEHEKMLELIAKQALALESESSQLDEELQERIRRLGEMQQKAAMLFESPPSANNDGLSGICESSTQVSEADVDLALLKLQEAGAPKTKAPHSGKNSGEKL